MHFAHFLFAHEMFSFHPSTCRSLRKTKSPQIWGFNFFHYFFHFPTKKTTPPVKWAPQLTMYKKTLKILFWKNETLTISMLWGRTIKIKYFSSISRPIGNHEMRSIKFERVTLHQICFLHCNHGNCKILTSGTLLISFNILPVKI